MRRVVDTSAWIEWLANTPTAGLIADKLPAPDEWLVPTIVQLELAKWVWRELAPDHAQEVLASSSKCLVAPLDTDLALASAEACRRFRLSTADAIVYATARAEGADLLTCDGHFKGLPDVVLVEKAGAGSAG
ncbi:MAG TPA: type II toxin-antitoxin system VapC family toxin [Caulobacteraceae bacterium]|nr:type II toxin-antitoxin system VapC family toxin [Caulobacteraceae bacterium]